MYTLFQSISNTLPQTAYLKLIDYWLIFSLILPLVIFTVHMAWEMQRANRDRKPNVVVGPTAWSKKSRASGVQSKLAIQALLILVTFLFMVGYWFYAFRVYGAELN